MDYERIYREFITDRREKESRLEGYTEVHHIVPRCMGGSDCATNLISLTPEDHYFAHLLLAYAYGGKLWAPLIIMSRPARQVGVFSRNKRTRAIVAAARRKSSEYQLGAKRPSVSAKLSGRPKSLEHRAAISKSRMGWRDTVETKLKKKAAMNDPSVREKIFTESHAAKISSALRGRVRTKEHSAAISAKAIGRYAGEKNPRYDHTIRTFVNASGIVESTTKFELARKYDLNRTCLNYVISGKRYQTGGWRLLNSC